MIAVDHQSLATQHSTALLAEVWNTTIYDGRQLAKSAEHPLVKTRSWNTFPG